MKFPTLLMTLIPFAAGVAAGYYCGKWLDTRELGKKKEPQTTPNLELVIDNGEEEQG